MKWTAELQTAVAQVARDYTEVKYRNDLMADCRSRAREYVSVAPGYMLDPAQVEYTHCLLQRLVRGVASHDAFEAAWRAAYSAQQNLA